MSEYGDRLQLALTERKVSINALRVHLGVTYQAVKRVIDKKTKEFSATNHAKTAAFLNINPDWLLDGSGEMTAPIPTGKALSGKARQLGMLLDRVKDPDERRELFSFCVLVLSRNPRYMLPYPAPKLPPPDTTQISPEHNQDAPPR